MIEQTDRRILYLIVAVLIILVACHKQPAAEDSRVTDFQTYASPTSQFDFAKAYEKGLSQSEIQVDLHYLSLQATYRKHLSVFLTEMLNLEQVDQALAQLGVEDIDTTTLPADSIENYYRHLSGFEVDTIYLRNNLHIERLTELEARQLQQIHQGKLKKQQSIRQLIETSYARVIAYDSDGKDYFINYRDWQAEPTAHSQDLVFYVAPLTREAPKDAKKQVQKFFQSYQLTHENRLAVDVRFIIE